MSKKLRVEDIATQTFTRQKPDGAIVQWHQEDESAVTSKIEAVAVVQRTIDFWLPKLVTDLQQQKNMPLAQAIALAQQSFTTTLTEMLGQPFSRRWGLTLTDFTFHLEDEQPK